MKLFQQLMLAPAALGLVAPLAAQANGLDLASSTNAINNYTQQQDLDRFRAWEAQNQVTSINQFSDVQPTSWAYQALSNLIERYGCVAGYPNGTFKGGQALTRYEAAALLNACLDRVTETTDELQRLINEFQKELAVLKGRVDGLEKKVGKLEATQFSTTTKLQGATDWVLGGVNFGGKNNNAINGSQRNNSLYGGTTLNYEVRLALNTSFTGSDLLFTRLRSGNFNNSAFSGTNPYNLLALDRAVSPPSGPNNVFIDRLWYRFPLNKEFTAALGPIGRNTEFLAINPSYFDAQLLDFFTTHGAPGTYNKATNAIAAVIWKQQVKKGKPFFAASSSIVFPNAANANTGTGAPGSPTSGGIFANNSAGSWLTQLGYQAQQWKATFAWRYGQAGSAARSGTQAAVAPIPFGNGGPNGWLSDNSTNNFALNLAWQPKKNGTVVPSFSAGWGYNSYAYSNTNSNTPANAVNPNGANLNTGISNQLQASNIAATQSWTVGLQWTDAFAKGNTLGVAVGQPNFVTSTRNGVTPQDGNYAWQWWYKFQVTDNISVTPALFYLTNPSSAGAYQGPTTGVNGSTTNPNTAANAFGGLLQAQFRF